MLLLGTACWLDPIQTHHICFYFLSVESPLVSPQKCSCSNLLPTQRAAFQYLKNSSSLIVFKSDKNLGPVILEHTEYITQALSKHLLTDTYHQLTEHAATGWIQAIRWLLCHFIENFTQPTSWDRKFLHAGFWPLWVFLSPHQNPQSSLNYALFPSVVVFYMV